MKRIKLLLFLIICLVCFGWNVYAEGEGGQQAPDVTWSQIAAKFKDYVDANGQHDCTVDGNNITISSKAGSSSSITPIVFNYNEGSTVVSASNNSQDAIEGAIFSFYADIMAATIAELYTVDIKRINESDFSTYGITVQKESLNTDNFDLSSVDPNVSGLIGNILDNFEGSTGIVRSYSINLNTFKSAIVANNLVGTYNQSSNQSSSDITVLNPTVELLLGDVTGTSIELITKITNLPDTVTAKCDIYLVPDGETDYSTGSSYIVGTINNCKNGSSYTVEGLKANSKYAFNVVLSTTSGDSFVPVTGESSFKFSTGTGSSSTTGATTTGKNNVKNPKTGSPFTLILVLLIVSAISIVLVRKVENVKTY